MLTGVLNVHKPPGVTSARVVGRVRHLLPRYTSDGRKIRVGHAGTLDRFASGVLLILIGPATRTSETLMSQPKQYVATIELGSTTPTLDPESQVSKIIGTRVVSREDIARALAKQVGEVEQVPPSFSALKVGGMRASDRVRAGETVQLLPRTVRIDRIDMLHYDWPTLQVRIDCGRGTYVRAIARDLGEELSCGGYLTKLTRTRIGDFNLTNALRLDDLTTQMIEEHLEA